MTKEEKIQEISENGDKEFLNLEARFEELLIEVEDYSLARSESITPLNDKFNEIKKIAKELNKLTKRYQKLITK